VMLALRVARAATGRDRVVKLAEHFHGWSDVVSSFIDETGATRTPPGVPAAVGALTTVVSSTDVTALATALAGRDVAAVILEPSGAHYGTMTLDPAYVAAARAACTAAGTVLIFDEVVTGFRVAPGGMQSVLGITPDLSVLGKIMAGGLPGGAVVGRGDLLALLTSAIAHAGTYNANPLSAVAGIATLRLIADGVPQQTAEAYAVNLEREWSAALITAGISGMVWRMSSIIHVKLDDPAAQSRIGNAMRAHRIDPLNTSAFCSSVHTSADLERSATAFAGAIVAASSGA
jgi:glutamate-1-semialdehyde 2,1-aminomutase